MKPYLIFALALTLLASSATRARAAWPNLSTANVPICTAVNSQNAPVIITDGAGGAIIVWYDNRGANNDIYAQHVLASGAVDPAWPANGRALCTATGEQYVPMAVADGAGGAIVTWYDNRSGTGFDIYAQHVMASGALDPAWPLDGRALCTATNQQYVPKIVTDGAGGAIVTWYDLRGGVSYDIYAQHVQASGAVDPAWPIDGRALCTATNIQLDPAIVADGAGGAIVTWHDLRGGVSYDIYAQHVRASGAVDPTWPLDGRALCTLVNNQLAPTIVSDGSGGAIILWHDIRGGVAYDIYAQHVFASGSVDPSWPADGRALCTAAGNQSDPKSVSDGAGGAFVTWSDGRGATNDVYVQHVLASGAVDPAWPLDGQALCTAIGNQTTPSLINDGAGGAIVAWKDLRGGSFADIYAQHVLSSGAVDPAWPVDGRALSNATYEQTGPVIIPDGAGGAIITWQDSRTGSTDIYAQRVARHGYLGTPEGELAGVKDIPNDNGGKVKVSWNASYLDLAQDANLAAYDILRSVPPNVAAFRLARGERVAASLAELAEAPGADRMLVLPQATQVYYWELLGSVAALHYVSGYGYIAATLGDSIAAGNPRTAFMVVARNASGSMFWPSRPDSGYSVDNLPPAAPAPFAANYAAGTSYLHWDRNAEVDLAGYRLYRGASPSFTPSPATLIAALPDTGYADPASATYTYKLTAIDVHGNESLVATISPTGITGVDDGPAVGELALAPVSPNPAARGTTLRFGLPQRANISLGIHDAAGRLVRSLANGPLAAGEHAAEWDLRDGAGRTVGAGLYFARLEVGGRVLTRRIAVTL